MKRFIGWLCMVVLLLGVASPSVAQIGVGTVNVKNLLNTQGSTTSGQSGVLQLGAVTTAAPTYTTAQTSPLSLDTSGNLRTNCITGCAAVADTATASTALGALNATIVVALAGNRGASFQLLGAGTLVATVTPEYSPDAQTTWYAAYFQDPFTGVQSTTATITSAQAATNFQVQVPQGSSHARVRVSAFTSGTANWTARSAVVTWPGLAWGIVTTAAPTYTTGQINGISLDTSGQLRVALAANQSVNIAQYGGTATTLGQKVMASSVPVVVASDQSNLPVLQQGMSLTATGQQAVTATATALPANAAKRVCVKVLAAGTQDPIYFGITGVTTTTGQELSVRDAWCGNIANSSQVFVIAAATGSTVAFDVLN